MKHELSLFLLGSPLSDYLVQDTHVDSALSLLTTQHDLPLKLRALWFLEKLAQNEQLMKKKTADGT